MLPSARLLISRAFGSNGGVLFSRNAQQHSLSLQFQTRFSSRSSIGAQVPSLRKLAQRFRRRPYSRFSLYVKQKWQTAFKLPPQSISGAGEMGVPVPHSSWASNITAKRVQFREATKRVMKSNNRKAYRQHLEKRRAQMLKAKESFKKKSKQAGHGLMALWRRYGYVGVAVYMSVYGGSMGLAFLSLRGGILTSDHIRSLAEKFNMKELIKEENFNKADSKWGQLVIAWIAVKVIEPLRAITTIAITPSVAKLLRRRGWIKPI